VPALGVDGGRCAAALEGGALATDEVMRRVEAGRPFRRAYREVSAALGEGARFPAPSARALLARRRSTGGLGNLGLPAARARLQACRRWGQRERRRFEAALHRLAGRGPGRKL
jgi:hypothetical protein